VAEGIKSTEAVVGLAQRCGVEMPISTQMHAMLLGERSPRDAVRQLMDRSLKSE